MIPTVTSNKNIRVFEIQTLNLKEKLLYYLRYNLIKKVIFASTVLLVPLVTGFANQSNQEKSASVKTKKSNPKTDAAEKQRLSEELALAEKMSLLLQYEIELKPELKPWYHMVPYYLSLSVAAILGCFLIGQGLIFAGKEIRKSSQHILDVHGKTEDFEKLLDAQKRNLLQLSKEFQTHFQLVTESFTDLNKKLRDLQPPTHLIVPPPLTSSQKNFSNIIEG